jgi:GT2 family glycosyltransferase
MSNFDLSNLNSGHLLKSLSDFLNISVGDLKIIATGETDFKVGQRKVFFKLYSSSLGDVHLTCGSDLVGAWNNLKQVHEEIPQLTCKPLFHFVTSDYEILGQTFFDGIQIDRCLEQGIISEATTYQIICSIQSTFASISENSTEDELLDELDGFLKSVSLNSKLTKIDCEILESVCFSFLKENANNFIPTKRWSNGDLAARNILVSKEGQFRIIDWEFAHKSHFADEDWIRLKFYSNQHLKSLSCFNEQKITNAAFLEVYFWLKQFCLDYQVQGSTEVENYLRVNLTNAFLNAKTDKTDGESISLFLDGIHKEFNNVERKYFIEFHAGLEKEIKSQEIRSKLNRMMNSFSWKSTGFLRFLRRKSIDKWNREKKSNKSLFNFERKDKSFDYSSWIEKKDTINRKRKKIFHLEYEQLISPPLISILLPVYDTDEEYLELTIKSVLNQVYKNWELCIVNDASTKLYIKPFLDNLANSDNRIKVLHRDTNGHIAKSTNECAVLSHGEYIVFLDHDDLLRPHSLLRIAQQINENPFAGLIYSDEDKIDVSGKRYDHYFKPDWNPDLFHSQNYICHLVCCKKEYFFKVGGLQEGIEGSQDWDLLLKITEELKAEQIIHIPEVLYHWRASESSTALSLECKKYVLEKSLNVLSDFVSKKGISAKAEICNKKNGYIRVKYDLPQNLPLVSIIIPTRNRLDLISRCVESIIERTSYKKIEILILDHESTESKVKDYLSKIKKIPCIRIFQVGGEFNFSKINNYGARKAEGDILLFLNNDIEILESDWLSEMVSQSLRTEIGCVGAKLVYPDNSIQHGGVIVGLGGVAGHSHKHYSNENPGYKHRLQLVQNYLAVTAACLAVRKEIFDSVGGFNEIDLKVAFNDVDFCLRVYEKGYRNLWTPYALLKHHESASRGKDSVPDKIERFKKEINYMQSRWEKYIKHDPSYNKNLNKNREDFSLAFNN